MNLESNFAKQILIFIRLMKDLDFTLAKGTRRSTLFKLGKESKKKMMLEKKKLSLRRA